MIHSRSTPLGPLARATTVTVLILLFCSKGITCNGVSETYFLGGQGNFSCTSGVNKNVDWRLNGTNIDDLPALLQGHLTVHNVTVLQALVLHTLTMKLGPEFNETRIECVEDQLPLMEKVIYLQGPLSEIMNVSIRSNSTSVIISWSAPFSLDVSGVDPDIRYSVLIYNVTDNPTAIPCTDCMDITETHYTFTPDYPSPCHKYIFTVIPLNGAGQGHSSNVTGHTVQELPSDIHLSSDVIIEENNIIATVNFLGDIENVCTFALRVVGLDITYSSYSQFSNGTVVFKVPVSDVKPHREYEVFIELSNPAGSITTPFTTFKTSACQQTTAYINGREISIKGNLTAIFPAQGCFIFLGGNIEECYALQQNNDKVYHQSNDTGFESVCVYDIMEDGLPSSFPAVAMTLDDSQSHEIVQPPPIQNITTADILLTRAELSRNGVQISIICDLTLEASCVLVYQSNHTTLSVKEYGGSTIFPVSETVDEDTSLFLFGKNGELQQEPLLTLREGETHVVYDTRNMDDDNTDDVSTTATVTISGVVVVVGVVVVCVAVVLLVMVRLRRRKKVVTICGEYSEREDPPQMRISSSSRASGTKEWTSDRDSGTESNASDSGSDSDSDSGGNDSDSGMVANEFGLACPVINGVEKILVGSPVIMYDSDGVEEIQFSDTDFKMPLSESKILCDGDSEVVAGVKGQTPPTDARDDETRGGKVSLLGEGEYEVISAHITMRSEALCVDELCLLMDWESEDEDDDDDDGNTESGSCVESVTCSEEEEEEGAHVVILGGTIHSTSIFGKCCGTCTYYLLTTHHGTCVLDDKCSHEQSGLSVVKDMVINAAIVNEQISTVTPFDFVCDPFPKPGTFVNKVVSGREFISGVEPVTLAPAYTAHFTGPPTSNRATEQATVDHSVTPLRDVSHLESDNELHLQMKPECTERDDEGAERYREMIAPAFYSRHFIFEQVGMMVTGTDSADPSDNDEVNSDPPDIQQNQPLPETTPTKPHPPPETSSQLPQQENIVASAEEMPSQKPQWNDPPANFKEKVLKWFSTGNTLGFNGQGNQLFFWGLPSYG